MVLPIAPFALHAFPRSGIISSDIVLLTTGASGVVKMTAEKPLSKRPNIYYVYIAKSASNDME
jgi:hypothetical protein